MLSPEFVLPAEFIEHKESWQKDYIDKYIEAYKNIEKEIVEAKQHKNWKEASEYLKNYV